MTHELAARADATFLSLADAIATMADPHQANEVRARISAAKAWAKAHGRLKEFRLELLTLEVEALVKTWELGGESHLTSTECQAAAYLAVLAADERAALISEHASRTSAAGLVRAVREAEERDERRQRGTHWASAPDYVTPDRDSVSERLSAILDDLTAEGVPFSVVELADRLVQGRDWPVDDDAFRDGVNRLCRDVVRRGSTLLSGIELPKWLTVRVADTEEGVSANRYLRVPIAAATLAHFADHISIREQQLADDRAAITRLRKAYAALELRSVAHTDQIGDLLLSAEEESAA